MHRPDFLIWCTVLTVTLVGPAMVTDLRWRRIPNYLTFPALGAAMVARTAVLGWSGLGLALAGAVISPLLLLLFHGGRGLGMGDLKLAMAIGAIAGPVTAAVMMFLAAVIGGIQAIVVMLRHGGLLSQLLSTFTIGLPFLKKKRKDTNKSVDTNGKSPKVLTMPYGVSIGIGSLLTLAVIWCTGKENWFLSFVKIAANQ
jgi:prepilin peptidase CpaA